MGFASGTVTFRRYSICGAHPDSLSEEWLSAIAARAFGRQREEQSDGVETGWIVPNHLFDVDFSSPERIEYDCFVYLAMRMDRTAPPASIVRSYQRMEEAAALEASGRDFLSRTERRLAKEAAVGRAEKEARAGMFRRSSAYPVLIDLRNGVVYFGNLGSAAGSRLLTLFSETFDTTLASNSAEEAAYRIADRKGWVRAFEDCQPSHFAPAPMSGADDGSAVFPGEDRSFLGREFLAWVWFRTERREGLFELPNGEGVTVAIDRAMHLVCSYDLTGTDTIRCDVPGSSPEARAALQIGKVPTKMGLLIGSAAQEWALTLDGPGLGVSGLRLEKPEEDDPRAQLGERFGQICGFGMVLDGLFEVFLRERLQDEWRQASAAMSRWAAGDKIQAQRATA